MTDSLPPEYRHLTLADLLRLYVDGPAPLPCPPELERWVESAITLREIQETEAEIERLERAQN